MTERARATVIVDPEAPAVAYTPFLFGAFIEHFGRQIYGGIFEPGSPLSDQSGFRLDVIEALKQLQLSVTRWPGGCFASGYHWRSGVGERREPTFDVVWGVEDPNSFGTDEFVAWCRLVGCEPYICTNAGNGTPAEMRDWVEYCNGTGREGNGAGKVRLWSIGNENWGPHEIGFRTPEEWGPLVAQCAEGMLEADPGLSLVAAGTADAYWTLPLLEAAGEYLDYVAIHQYWVPCWAENHRPDYLSCITLSQGPEETIRAVIDLLQRAGVRGRVKIAFDEWNLRGWHHPGFPRREPSDPEDPVTRDFIARRRENDIASQYTMADALFSASLLNACLRNAEDVGMANIAPIVNTRGPLYVHPEGIVKRTTFHVLSLYANELQDRVVDTEVEADMLVHGDHSLPVVDAVATVDASSTSWSIALVNRHPSETVLCGLRMGEPLLLDRDHEATVLCGDSPDAFNDVETPDRVVPEKRELVGGDGLLRLPPHSLSVVHVARP
jgi:alpha-N-arabinofuranosidase